MSESSKEYIECRLFILGDEKVGKKSFVQKILNLPCTSTIRNIEAEEEYNKLYSQMKEKIEKEKIRLEQQQALLQSINDENMSKKESEITSKFTSTKTLFKIEEERPRSRKSTTNLGKKGENTTRNVTATNIDQGSQNNSSQIIDMSSLHKKKTFREPVPEYPAKLYSVNLNKIVIKMFCIPKAEKLQTDFIPRDDDEEYELEKEHNISFDGIKKDLNEKLGVKDTVISQEKLNGFNTSIFTLFVFLYDLSNFYTFESLILYYSRIAKMYHLNDEENFKACIIGNKKDKKVYMETEQESVFNEFLKNTQLKKFEISTKPYFLFDNFFIDFFLECFSMFQQNQTQTQLPIQHNKLLEDNSFKEQFKKLVKNRPNFARSNRSEIALSSCSPGPEYNVNLYSFNSLEEIKEVFKNKKYRFNRKIFANKSGPILNKEKKDFSIKNKDKEININYSLKGGLFNKPINGYSFGIVKGKLNLIEKRKELRNKRNLDFLENIDTYNNSPVNKKPLKLSKDEDYFKKIVKKRNQKFETIIKERQLKMDKIMALHNENLKQLEIKKDLRDKKVLNNQKLRLNLQKSASSPNILFNSFSSGEELNEEKNLNKQRYHDIIYRKNRENLEKYKEKLSSIRLISSMQKEPEPYFEDIREKILNPLKGRKILEKFKVVEKFEDAPKYQRIKDDFDKIAEKATNFRPNYAERFPSTEKLMLEKEEAIKTFEEYEKKDEEKRLKMELNRENSSRNMRIKSFIGNRRDKLYNHYILLQKEQLNREAMNEMRREISIQKGYGDPTLLLPINYSQIEENSPRYSIKGRYESHEIRNDDPGNLILGTNLEKLNYIKEAQKKQPLPNFNYIKPKLPSIVFSKAERFPKVKNQYEDSVVLFEDGIFQPNTHKDFTCLEPMSNMSPRSGDINSSPYKKSPSPAEYKIKSSFDIIAQEGEKISKIKDKLRKQNQKEDKKTENKNGNVKEENNDNKLVLSLDY